MKQSNHSEKRSSQHGSRNHRGLGHEFVSGRRQGSSPRVRGLGMSILGG